MARVIGKLTAIGVEKAKKPGLYADGGGLYLRVTKEGAKNWIFRFMLNRKARSMGLGPVSLYGLQEARGMAHDARKLRHQGIDPIEARRIKAMKDRLDAAKAITFDECARKYIKSHRAGWRNGKHAAQWESTLAAYARPIIGALAVCDIDTGAVMRVLEQDVDGATLWMARTETASRVRQRIEAILDWAKVRGHREGENPARWKGHLDKLLPAKNKVREVEHHPALPYREMRGFMTELRAQEGVAPRTFEFALLTAARTGEVLGATWGEIGINERVWTIPASRMKGKREHRVPLSDRAVAILKEMRLLAPANGPNGAFVFPGMKRGRPLSSMTFLMLLRRMGRDGLTAHGFRSTFRDWAAERGFPDEVCELALAHAVSDKVLAAYKRTGLFERRRELAAAWAAFCGTAEAADNVIEMRERELRGAR
jgi:integrase